MTDQALDPQRDGTSPHRATLSLSARIGVLVLAFWVASAIFGPWIAPYGIFDDPADASLAPPSHDFWLGSDILLPGHAFPYPARSTAHHRIVAPLGRKREERIVESAEQRIEPRRTACRGETERNADEIGESRGARGEGLGWIIAREIWPNAWMPLLTDFGMRLVFVILFISALSFLGLGVQPPQVDWGSMVRENLIGIYRAAPALLAPAASIASLTIAINLIVDDLSAMSGGAVAGEIR